ncbi:hypothetical protein ABKN59_006957 [Abortiporus biennis]
MCGVIHHVLIFQCGQIYNPWNQLPHYLYSPHYDHRYGGNQPFQRLLGELFPYWVRNTEFCYCPYARQNFASLRHAGIDPMMYGCGRYIHCFNIIGEIPCGFNSVQQPGHIDADCKYNQAYSTVKPNEAPVFLRPSSSPPSGECIDKSWIQVGRVHISVSLAPYIQDACHQTHNASPPTPLSDQLDAVDAGQISCMLHETVTSDKIYMQKLNTAIKNIKEGDKLSSSD